MTNPNYIPREHPVSRLLHSAAHSGQSLSSRDMGVLDQASEATPGGGSFTGMKSDITAASKQIAALHAQGRTGEARDLADTTAATLAGRMSDEQRAVTEHTIQQAQQNTRDLEDIDAMVRDNLAGN